MGNTLIIRSYIKEHFYDNITIDSLLGTRNNLLSIKLMTTVYGIIYDEKKVKLRLLQQCYHFVSLVVCQHCCPSQWIFLHTFFNKTHLNYKTMRLLFCCSLCKLALWALQQFCMIYEHGHANLKSKDHPVSVNSFSAEDTAIVHRG